MHVSTFERRARRIRLRLRRYPALQPLVNRVGLIAWKRHLRRQHPSLHVPDPGRLLWIDPATIHRFYPRQELLASVGAELQRFMVGKVRGGDWDLADRPLDELLVFDAIEQRVQGAEWNDTRFVKTISALVKNGQPQFKFRSSNDIPIQLTQIDGLIARVRTEGFRTQLELRTGRPWDEILVAFDRRGRIRFVDGRHRLAIARALGIKSVPVIGTVRHSDWCTFTQDMRAYVASRGGTSYQPLLHPDLGDIPAHQGQERFNLIVSALPISQGRLLDIGANKGYFSQRFEQAGFDVVAVERSAKELYFLERLRDAGEHRFSIFAGSIFETPDVESFDVVLALNVFHHFLKTEESYRLMVDFLRRIRASYLIFEPHLREDRQMQHAYLNPGPLEFVRLIQEHTGLTTSIEIGSAIDGRPIFLLAT